MQISNALPLFFIIALSLTAAPRTWTAKDGRVIQAEFVSANKDSVSVRRDDGLTLSIPLSMLSADDIAWINRQPKPIEVSQEQLDKIISTFPKAASLGNGEVTNDLEQLHDRYESLVKFIRPGTIAQNLKMIRKRADDDIKVFSEIAKTSSGDGTGKRRSGQSQGAENGILSARRSLSWLQSLLSYLQQFDALTGAAK
ncbi:MAG: hypothetical protein JF599_03010 [Verrucomicrobia bacterium]|nr:hypothetical protein [Verrucomicrobiota bacterium]